MILKCSVVDLTPEHAVPMGGNDGPERLTIDRHGKLEANIIMWECLPEPVAIIAIDSLFVGPDLTSSIMASFSKWHNLPQERVFILASHTHFAPMLDRTKPRLGKIAEEELLRWQRLIDAGIARLSTREASHVATGRGDTNRSVNRRYRWRLPTIVRILGKTKSNIYLCDNPGGSRDPTIRIFLYQDIAGHCSAIVWSFACHPVGFPHPDTASADFVGVVREKLRRQYGELTPIIFAPGCMGDVRPKSPRPWKNLRNLFRIAIYGPQAPSFSYSDWDNWANGLADEVLSFIKDTSRAALHNTECPAMSTIIPLENVFVGAAPVNQLHGKAMMVPGIGRVVSLSCEPVSAVAELFSNNPTDLVLGYEGNVFGYLPTDQLIAEGGYESDRFMKSFGLDGYWKPNLDNTIRSLARSLDLKNLDEKDVH